METFAVQDLTLAYPESNANALDGVTARVDLEHKTATVTLSAPVADDVLRSAVTDAGYEVVSIS